MRQLFRDVILALAGMCGAAALVEAQSAEERLALIKKQIAQAPVFEFGKVRAEDPVEHVFTFRNSGTEALEVKTVQLTPPLEVTKMGRQIGPGESASIVIRLGQRRGHGDFEGVVIVHFTKADAPPVFFRVQGRVVGAIEFEPMRAFFVTAFRGEPAERTLDITNYDNRPLEILKTEHDNAFFTTNLLTVEKGHQYRLTLRTKATAPAGKTQDTIRLITSNSERPVILVPANLQIRERVYSFPDSVALGSLDRAALATGSGGPASASQALTVYQRKGTDFQVNATSDLPFLRLTKRQAGLRDRYEVQVDIIPEKLLPGPIQGCIRITTNDAEFPRLEIPVTGEVARD